MPQLRASTTTPRYKSKVLDLPAQPLHLLVQLHERLQLVPQGAEGLPSKLTKLRARINHCLSD